MPTPAIQTLINDAQQVLNLDSISAVRSVVAVSLANANTGTPLNPNLTTQQLWNEFYQVVTRSKSDIESIIANQLMKFLFSPPAPGGVGANKQVIFNDNGILAGDAGLTYDKATDSLTISGAANFNGGALAAYLNGSLLVGSSGNVVNLYAQSSGLHIKNNTGTFPLLTVNNSGDYTFQDGAGGTRMTLNSTGLGLGQTPISNAGIIQVGRSNNTGFSDIGTYGYSFAETYQWVIGPSTQGNNNNLSKMWRMRVDKPASASSGSSFSIGAYTGYDASVPGNYVPSSGWLDRLTIDNSGNVGIGVTPSAWASIYKTVEFANGSSIWGQTDIPQLSLQTNAFLNSSFQWIYKTAAAASNYRQTAGAHLWFTAPSGTAGNVITFTERLRLKETGQLRFVPLASDPSGAEAGDVYYNSTSNKLKCYNGTTWNDLF